MWRMTEILQNQASEYRWWRKRRLKRCHRGSAVQLQGIGIRFIQSSGLVNETRNLTLQHGCNGQFRIAPAQFPKFRGCAIRRKLNPQLYGGCVQKPWRENPLNFRAS
jgi:hypothetical protein